MHLLHIVPRIHGSTLSIHMLHQHEGRLCRGHGISDNTTDDDQVHQAYKALRPILVVIMKCVLTPLNLDW